MSNAEMTYVYDIADLDSISDRIGIKHQNSNFICMKIKVQFDRVSHGGGVAHVSLPLSCSSGSPGVPPHPSRCHISASRGM